MAIELDGEAIEAVRSYPKQTGESPEINPAMKKCYAGDRADRFLRFSFHLHLLLAALLGGSTLGYAQSPGEVQAEQKISDTEGNFTGVLNNVDEFGFALAALGDLDGDGVGDLAVGAPTDGNVGNRGAVWILFLNDDGTVKSHQKISENEGGFTGTIEPTDLFGFSLASLGDLDGDGIIDLVVGEPLDGATNTGAVWILFLNSNGTVNSHQKISNTQGNFTGAIGAGDRFGADVASLGDLDGDGVIDLAVGADLDDDGGTNRGAVWILSLNTNGTVSSHQKISDTQGNFTGALNNGDFLGGAVTLLEDVNGDGVDDLAVGAVGDDSGGDSNVGAVWILFLETDGTVSGHQKIDDQEGNFAGDLDETDFFGTSVASLGDLDLDGVTDLAVGSIGDDDAVGGDENQGAVWILLLQSDGTVKSSQKISETEGNFGGDLHLTDRFGNDVVSLGDLDGDIVSDLAVGAYHDDDGGPVRGAVWILFLESGNGPPTADAGSDQSTHAGQTVFLDGSGSFDDNTASGLLAYTWSATSIPAGSSAVLAGADTATPDFFADLPGTYVLSLVVTDEGGLSSAPDIVEVSSTNLTPTADAGDDLGGAVGVLVDLDGSASSDPELDPFTFSWSIQQAPLGSTASLSGANTQTPSFVPDLEGIFTIRLVVNDGFEDSAPDEVEVTVVSGANFAETLIMAALDHVAGIPTSGVTAKGNQRALMNFLSQAIRAIQENDLDKARDKLDKAIARTDGCALRGGPDGNGSGRDWITGCADQQLVYDLLSQALVAIVP